MRFMKSAIAGLAGAMFALAAHATDITGAGSTFAAPIYTKWADAYAKAGGGNVNYQGIGSSGGRASSMIVATVLFSTSAGTSPKLLAIMYSRPTCRAATMPIRPKAPKGRRSAM